MKRFFCTLVALLWAASAWAQVPMTGAGLAKPAGGAAVAPAFNWVTAQDTSFVGGATQVDVGFTAPTAACGTFTAGDFLVAGAAVESDAGDTINIPAGWTILGTQITTSGNTIVKFAYKIASGSESCGAAGIRFTWTNSHFSAWFLVNYNGANATPLDGTPTTTTYTASGTSISLSGPTIASQPSRLIEILWTDVVISLTPAATTTSRFNAQQESGTLILAVSDRAVSSNGATSDTATTSSGATGAYAMFAVTHP